MFSDFREEYGNCDVLICESNNMNILETMQAKLVSFGRLQLCSILSNNDQILAPYSLLLDFSFYKDRTPWPWMQKFGETGGITEGHYYRVLEVARRMVNPRTVIFTTSAVNNNGISDEFASMRRDNEAVRRFVQHYQPPEYAEDGVQNVMLLDWERLTDDLVIANAESMGIPGHMAFTHVLTGNGLTHKKSFTGVNWYPQLTAMACGSISEPTHPKRIPTCMDDTRGRISPDGKQLRCIHVFVKHC